MSGGAITTMAAVAAVLAQSAESGLPKFDITDNWDCVSGHCPTCNSDQIEKFKDLGALMLCKTCGMVFPRQLWYSN